MAGAAGFGGQASSAAVQMAMQQVAARGLSPASSAFAAALPRVDAMASMQARSAPLSVFSFVRPFVRSLSHARPRARRRVFVRGRPA